MDNVEKFIRDLREQVFASFFSWLDLHKGRIGKWYVQLYNEGLKAKADCDTPGAVMGYGMWMFNMIANLGVNAGIGINEYHLQSLAEGIDEQSTRRLLALIGSSFSLQFLPKDRMGPIPIISATKFSLKEYARQRAQYAV